MKDIKETIRIKLHENFMEEAGKPAPEKTEKEKEEDAVERRKKSGEPPLAPGAGDKKAAEALYASVYSRLQNDIINHAAIIRQLWKDSDNASARSLFRKKLEQEKMTNGEGSYQFTMDELIKISNIINKAGKAMVASAT